MAKAWKTCKSASIINLSEKKTFLFALFAFNLFRLIPIHILAISAFLFGRFVHPFFYSILLAQKKHSFGCALDCLLFFQMRVNSTTSFRLGTISHEFLLKELQLRHEHFWPFWIKIFRKSWPNCRISRVFIDNHDMSTDSTFFDSAFLTEWNNQTAF